LLKSRNILVLKKESSKGGRVTPATQNIYFMGKANNIVTPSGTE
jgi:hypothetical protein